MEEARYNFLRTGGGHKWVGTLEFKHASRVLHKGMLPPSLPSDRGSPLSEKARHESFIESSLFAHDEAALNQRGLGWLWMHNSILNRLAVYTCRL